MYIDGLKEKVLEAKKEYISSLKYRELTFEMFKMIYPKIIQKYGENWISKEDFLELLFLEIYQLNPKQRMVLFHPFSDMPVEPIILKESEKDEYEYVYFKYDGESEWIDLNEELIDLSWYSDDDEVELESLTNKELLTEIEEWKELLIKTEDYDDARMLFLLQCEMIRRTS